ncbi:MAG: hypothetical protein KDK64_02250 [Chlamydiia bacterium]|nr:hypothetical protein [Chlamydiia bacterium]
MISTAWNQEHYCGGDGVIVAADMQQEWILKWWWNHYSASNSSPVTFFDLGMSKSASLWCQSKGTVIPFSLPQSTFKSQSEIPLDTQKTWESYNSSRVWECRNQWLHKPFLILQSPYDRTLWIDIDCEVKQSLTPLFSYCDTHDGISMVLLYLKEATVINSGVVVARRHAPAFSYWAESVLEKKAVCDETALIEAQKKHPIHIHPLPLEFNFLSFWKTPSKMGIVHHNGESGKHEILKQVK